MTRQRPKSSGLRSFLGILWPSYVDHELSLTPEQRKAVHQQAWRMWANDQRNLVLYAGLLVSYLVLLAPARDTGGVIAGWLGWGGFAYRLCRVAAMLALPIAVFVFGGAILQRWRFAPCVYRALREQGYDVCLHCGYWLRELPDEEGTCPECGRERAQMPSKDEVMRSSVRRGRITDVRGRTVELFDLTTAILLRRQDIIEAKVLGELTRERGIRITLPERISIGIGIIAPLLVAALYTFETYTGGVNRGLMARTAGVLFMCSIPWIVWRNLRQIRYANVAAALLKHARCPHCAYNLAHRDPDPEDGATVCPECGCAWNTSGKVAEGDEKDGNDG